MSGNDPEWRIKALQILADQGFVIIENVLPQSMIEKARRALYRVADHYNSVIGEASRQDAINAGYNEFRLLFNFERIFYDFLQIKPMLELLYLELSETAVLRFQNGAISEPDLAVNQHLNSYNFHMNFPYKFEHSQKMFMEFIFPFTEMPDLFDFVPGSHRLEEPPTSSYLEANAVNQIFHPGDMIVMTPFLWHREKPNHTQSAQLYTHHQFSRPFIKQHIDYCRAIEPEVISGLPESTLRLLGWYSRTPANLHEFHLPKNERLYRSGEW